ncbi:FecR family protein [Pseudomonas schmalbachii]|uniref:FecR domain-containing protein n=1 Tax=Pseudomonas schmalbachii TaxID=2816993 RepID=A0ABS3TJ82_9PSED|nr:FecR domain-containing protein [Pseudomonas schmalbachii]MBO3273721.1 FecR domain-containing protein [Pseudomonas schmalbachii]
MSLRKQDDAPLADEALARHREELKKRFPLPQPKPKRRSTTLGALLVLGVAAGSLAWLDPAYRSEHYSSAIGQRQVLDLADGSHVTLDGSSRIPVSWHLRSRRVELRAGQALFSVSPALYRPFRVSADATEVEVLGTRFNVDRQRDDVRVTVAEGKVVVRGNGASANLLPGDQIRGHAGQLGQPTRVDAEKVAAWKDGRLVFERTPLREVLATLQRYRDAPIHLDDPRLAELPVSGVFDSARPDSLLALLPQILPVKVSRENDGAVHLLGRDAEK